MLYPVGTLAFSVKFSTSAKAPELQLAVHSSLWFICPEGGLFLNSAQGSVLTAAEEEAQSRPHLSKSTVL